MSAKKPATKPLPPLPKEIRLPAGPYRVIRADIPPESDDHPNSTTWGKCDYESRIITVRPGISRNVAWLTLAHEKVHAVLFDAGVSLRHKTEESVCDALAAFLVYEMQQP